jgi:hypothetical protein
VYHDTEDREVEIIPETTVSENNEDADIVAPAEPLASLLTGIAHARSLSPDPTTSSTIRQKRSRAPIVPTQQQAPPSLVFPPPASEIPVNDHTEQPKSGPETQSGSKDSQSFRRPRTPRRPQGPSKAAQFCSLARAKEMKWLGRRFPHCKSLFIIPSSNPYISRALMLRILFVLTYVNTSFSRQHVP